MLCGLRGSIRRPLRPKQGLTRREYNFVTRAVSSQIEVDYKLTTSSPTKTKLRISQDRPIKKELQPYELEKLFIEYGVGSAFLNVTEGSPRFVSPFFPWNCYKNTQKKPLMIYLPGVDGTGYAGYRQFSRLQHFFELVILQIPSSDRTSFTDLIAIVKEYLVLAAQQSTTDRPIYLFGDSFGGVLAMAVAVECKDIVDRLILVNPASSFPRTPWKQLAPILGAMVTPQTYPFLPYVSIPFFGNMYGLVSHRIQDSSDPLQKLLQLREGMLEQLPELDALKSLFPLDCIQWKIKLTDEGCQYMTSQGYRHIQQRTLILVGDQDLVLPSKEEGDRLKSVLPRAKVVHFPECAHTLMLEQGTDVVKVIKENGFYTTKRNMSTIPKNNVRQSNGYGLAMPIELPTAKELQADSDGDGGPFSLSSIQQLVSPIYCSTDQNGAVSIGFENFPEGNPLLLVGNHQFMGLDLSLVVPKILQEKGIMVRGMTHPVIFADGEEMEKGDAFSIKGLFSSYGAVPNHPANMYRLLSLGESVMLFPGGATEGLKKQKYKYQLFWPERPEFVRMAARFGATIVPFSAIGVDDSVIEILASEDLLSLPIIGDNLKKDMLKIGERMNIDPRRWQGNSQELNQMLAFPVFLPAFPPSRSYIKFGQPIQTSQDWVNDKETCSEVYELVKSRVATGLDYLQLKREEDPYKDFFTRLLFEASWDFKRQAPTFNP
eukprot:TRINITY_DN12288_c0_g1_i1.p1 TRINITY_DN12288_c0_g1~~TRINITY_DN12288_c0_g1_i1.p1  ORF type:complete len:714 (+),score=35.25 TRINITY_DN12288_c0_g1_i1:137-2278(+)